jgi:hypothetical protein
MVGISTADKKNESGAGVRESFGLPPATRRVRAMSTAQARDYRRKSAEYTKIAGWTQSLEDASDYRKIAQAYRALAENEDRLADKSHPVTLA